MLLTEPAACDLPPGEMVQRRETVLAHSVDVVLRDGCKICFRIQITIFYVPCDKRG